uniref:Uncharacterized protein n=1 Tax=Aegilops tauschii subsp. strangulata TaxID=200361 RepID=A0A453R3Z3_AEGTS
MDMTIEAAANMRQHELSRKKCMAQMVLLVVLGVVISTFLLGAAIRYVCAWIDNGRRPFNLMF